MLAPKTSFVISTVPDSKADAALVRRMSLEAAATEAIVPESERALGLREATR